MAFASTLGLASAAQSATLVTTLSVRGSGGADCNDVNAERNIGTGEVAATITSVSSDCSGQGLYGPQVAFAEATFGSLRAVAGVTGGQAFDGSATSGTVTTPTSEAGAFFNDLLTFGIEKGSFVVPVDIRGSVSGSASGNLTGYDLSGAFTVRNTLNAVDFSVIGFLRDESTGVNNARDNTSVDTIRDVVIPIDRGFATIAFSVDVFANCTARTNSVPLGLSATCSAETSFGNSLRVLGGTVFDTNGNQVTTSVRSDSGFDYLQGVEPHSRNSAVVPLPSPLPLMAFGIAALALFHRLHRNTGVEESVTISSF